MYDSLLNLQKSRIWKMLAAIQNSLLVFCSISITLVIFATVFMRYILKTDLYGIDELILVIAFWLYFIGGASGSMEDSHIKADLVDVFLKNEVVRYRLKFVAKGIESLVLIIFAKFSIDLVILNFQRMPITPGLKIPYVITQISIAIGFVLMSIYAIYYMALFFTLAQKSHKWE